MRHPFRLWGVAVLGLVFLAGADIATAGEPVDPEAGAAVLEVDETRIKQLWDEGVDFFNAAVLERDPDKAAELYAKARAKFAEILVSSPSDEIAARLVERASVRSVVAMMTFTCSGGSARVFKKALNAAVESI